MLTKHRARSARSTFPRSQTLFGNRARGKPDRRPNEPMQPSGTLETKYRYVRNMRPSRFIIAAALAVCSAFPADLPAENLPERRPALIGSGPGSLVNLIDTQALFQKGQRDAWVMFECAILGDGVPRPTDFFTASPDSDLLKNEARRRLRQTRFIPAVYNHKRTWSWFSGTVVFVVVKGQPHLRI